jgi:NAD(P)-dependent dehydrogenase (short-subunit alcohol dehydrogenase family)
MLHRQGAARSRYRRINMSAPVILITGALTGIGRATALAFAREGATVVVSGRREQAGKALEAELHGLLQGHGAEVAFIQADVRHEDEVRRLVDQTVARFGRLDVAVNNAGVEARPGPLTEQSIEAYAAMFDTNVLGTLLSLKHELRVMQAQGSGSIINLSSTMGERGAANLSLYVASKHAVEGLTKSAALEAAAFGVRVNAVAPGPTDTPMLDRLADTAEKKAAFYAAVPLRRGGKPEEIAETILFLASAKASFVTGQIVRVNGGKTAS